MIPAVSSAGLRSADPDRWVADHPLPAAITAGAPAPYDRLNPFPAPLADRPERRAKRRPRRFEALLHTDMSTIALRWRVLQMSGHCTVYQHDAWVREIVAHLMNATTRPLFVEVRECGFDRTAMIWPLVSIRRFGCTIVQWLDLGVSDYAAPLIAASLALSPEEARAVWVAVKAALPRSDLIDIARIPDRIGGAENPLIHLAGLRRSALHASGVALDGDPDTLIARLAGRSMLRDLAKATNRLSAAGAVRVVLADTETMVDALFDVLMAHRRARFAELGRFDLLTRPDVEAFYRNAAKANLRSGSVRLFGLAVDEHWIATSYCLTDGSAIHGILLSMAGGVWKRCSPGLKLATENMVWARRQGLVYFDFTIGALPYKADLGAAPKHIVDLSETLSLRGRLLQTGLRSGAAARSAIVKRPALFARLKATRQTIRRLTARWA